MEPRVWTDSVLETRIVRELAWEPQLQNATIDVRVTEGNAVLRGELSTWSQRRAIELAVARVPGVRHIVNMTSVVGLRTPSDADLNMVVRRAIEASGVADHHRILAIVKNGRVTLTGSLHSEHDRAAILEHIRSTQGVEDVVDLMRVSVRSGVVLADPNTQQDLTSPEPAQVAGY